MDRSNFVVLLCMHHCHGLCPNQCQFILAFDQQREKDYEEPVPTVLKEKCDSQFSKKNIIRSVV